MTIELTILMPCLNEAETLATCIKKAHRGAAKAGIEPEAYEILIADNGSTDGSQDIAEAEGARLIHVDERGYGAALRGGIQNAKGTYIIMGDADDSYDWEAIAPFVEKLRMGVELVMGSRLEGKILPGAMPPLHRWLGNPVLTWMGNLLFGTRTSDFHCGLRGFHTKSMRKLNLKTSGMEFATEMVAKAGKFGLRIDEIPITLFPDGRTRKPHLRTWRDGWRHLSFMLAISPGWVLLIPGLGMLFFGLLGILFTLGAPLSIGAITFDVHTLLISALLTISGTQLLVFWIIARFYSAQAHILPANNFVKKLTNGNILTIGIIFGTIIILLGLIPLFIALSQWANVDFGPLNYEVTLRLLIPTLTLVTIVVHLMLCSFVIGLMKMGRT